METTYIIIGIIAGTVILIILMRLIINRGKDKSTYKETDADEPPDTSVFMENNPEEAAGEDRIGDVFEETDERFIPEDEIGKMKTGSEKEWARINNLLIKNELSDLHGREYYDVQEKIYLANEGKFSNDFDIFMIFRITEKGHVAMILAGNTEQRAAGEDTTPAKQLLAIIQCDNNLGNGIIEPYKGNLPENAWQDSESEIRFGNNILRPYDHVDLPPVEILSYQLEQLKDDYFAYLEKDTIYIRILREASVEDAVRLINILKNYHCE